MQTPRSVSKPVDGTPLITIVTVVLNGEEYLEQAIRSVINQPREHIEYIVIDGGSRDGTLDIIKRYAEQIDYWVSEPDEGIYDAMNKGWAASHGEFVYYLGADDVLLSLPASSLAKACRDGVDLVYGDVRLSNGRYFKSRYGMELLVNNSLHHQGLFLKRSLFAKPPFRKEYKVFSDFDLNQRLYKQRKRALAVHEPIALFRLTRTREQSRSAEFFQVVRDNFGIIIMMASYLFLKLRGLVFRLRGWDR
jgi:glycosyltransferase involved in cell wall biosynthesis